MKALRQQLALMAATNGRVLIFGESGTGKELIAHAIHAASLRSGEAFVEVNCAAIPEDMIESELFGHRRGSFAGAVDDKIGKLQKADGGTLFLDEVGDMSLQTQAKVLRALDEQRLEPVGAVESVQVDVRVVASTNKNLEEEIERGNFREDLFYRLNVVPFHVPPLRERMEDVPLLADHFLKEFTTAYGRKPKELTEDALQSLGDYPWPGNVRELSHVIERAVLWSKGSKLDIEHLGLEVPSDEPTGGEDQLPPSTGSRPAGMDLEQWERSLIEQALREADGNQTRAAQRLGISRDTLRYRLKKYGLQN
jgi:two-component system nitrogen regulation response regulator NtrX